MNISIYQLSDLAQSDYEEILNYIAEGNLSAAKRVRVEFDKIFINISKKP